MTTRTHTALHVLKGAVQAVLGAELTTGVYAQEMQGRLTVQFNRKPTDTEIERIEHASNKKIGECLEIEEFEMNRADAEQMYGTTMYDAFPVPDHIQILKIVRIPDWNLNACNHPHLKNTVEIGQIHIRKVRFRKAREQLEISFEII
jgi:alanyl-tRNA synthetase